ncbi:ABC transporter ATP-binding protein [Atopomonas sediminilitoris]|uniref:ABC transporter ATP-binding protein n=1 Tax=Atopomonas sediminilitoris TaxID=2919919 RepID=UPI001F4EB40B|nr:ATP-binding cassette domain-containing protein [Atopomonas sediminilitoris]MCJ8170009.1 ATP-binding cassette domain-containing protein [Atopomonas sediminilitoris]
MFELDQVCFRAGQRTLLAPLTLALRAGQITGLLGHNGSGKSTLLKLLARQQSAHSGTVRFAQRPLDAWPARAFARQVAYLPQHPPLTDGLRVHELVAMGRYPWHGALGRFSADDRQHVEQAIERTGLTALRQASVNQLSGGERQRAWLAMLLAQNSRFLLLDEPTSALDVAHQLQVLELIRQLCDERELGVVIVLHDINLASRICDDIIALRHGQLVFQGSPRELLQPQQLTQLYGVPMQTLPAPGYALPLAYIE